MGFIFKRIEETAKAHELRLLVKKYKKFILEDQQALEELNSKLRHLKTFQDRNINLCIEEIEEIINDDSYIGPTPSPFMEELIAKRPSKVRTRVTHGLLEDIPMSIKKSIEGMEAEKTDTIKVLIPEQCGNNLLKNIEDMAILVVMKRNAFSLSKSAKVLGLGERALRAKINRIKTKYPDEQIQ